MLCFSPSLKNHRTFGLFPAGRDPYNRGGVGRSIFCLLKSFEKVRSKHIKEKPDLAGKYKNISVAENNSIKCAWSQLMQPEFTNLRKCIFETNEDESRFCQLLINVVIATDIADRERRAGERVRWEKAFAGDSNWENEWKSLSEMELSTVDISLKATVVLEQIVLASDVAHTMQH